MCLAHTRIRPLRRRGPANASRIAGRDPQGLFYFRLLSREVPGDAAAAALEWAHRKSILYTDGLIQLAALASFQGVAALNAARALPEIGVEQRALDVMKAAALARALDGASQDLVTRDGSGLP